MAEPCPCRERLYVDTPEQNSSKQYRCQTLQFHADAILCCAVPYIAIASLNLTEPTRNYTLPGHAFALRLLTLHLHARAIPSVTLPVLIYVVLCFTTAEHGKTTHGRGCANTRRHATSLYFSVALHYLTLCRYTFTLRYNPLRYAAFATPYTTLPYSTAA